MDAPQLEFDFDANEARSGRVVFTIHTDLDPFGNRTDVIVVDGSTLGGTSLIECDDPRVEYYNGASEWPHEETL